MFCLLHCTAWQLNPLIFHAVTDLSKVESLEESRARVDYFMALSSSVYICLTSQDPILTAFVLTHKACHLAAEDPIHKVYTAIPIGALHQVSTTSFTQNPSSSVSNQLLILYTKTSFE